MKRKNVKSDNIAAVGYNIEDQILELEFNTRAVYHYKKVDPKTVLGLIFADSVGKFFSQKVKGKFDYVKGEYDD